MTRAAIRCRKMAATLVVATWVSMDAWAGQALAAGCPFELVGTWQLASSAEAQPTLLSFAPDGWANVLEPSGSGRRPQDFGIAAQVRYEPVPRRAPKRIEFQARRGNEVIAPGASSWEIIHYTDDSFVSRRSDSTAGEQSAWTRVQTHLYFLTFAARDATLGRDPAAFVIWTTLDGQKTELEALGTVARGATARFGRIPSELSQAFARESKRSDEVMMRIELSEAQYRRTHQVFEAWDGLLSRNALASEDPDSQASGLIDAAVQSINRCNMKLRLPASSSTTAAGSSNKAGPPLRALQLVRTIRKLNDRRHLPDKALPSPWQPPSVAP